MTSKDPPSHISPEGWMTLKALYAAPEDIDLYVGGLMEETVEGLPGPTFTCINALQFSRILKGGILATVQSNKTELCPILIYFSQQQKPYIIKEKTRGKIDERLKISCFNVNQM